MIFEIKKAQSIKNLALIETESLSFNVNLMKNTKALGETRNISVRFLVNNVEKASRKDVMEIASYAVLNKCEKYPKDTTLEQINNGTVQPTTDYRYEVFLNFYSETSSFA